MEITPSQFAQVEDCLPLQRGNVSLSNLQVLNAILVPVGGLDKLLTFVALLGSNKLKLVVLHDRAGAPHQKLEDLGRVNTN